MSPAPMSVPVQPAPDVDTARFWEATAAGELALCWCDACGRYLHPPLERCRTCAGPTRFRTVSGRGRIHSFITVRHAVAPGYTDRPGHVLVLVDLDDQDGLRLLAQLDPIPENGVQIGASVTAVLVPLPGGDHHVPVFRPEET